MDFGLCLVELCREMSGMHIEHIGEEAALK
jgi:hypothetical protein